MVLFCTLSVRVWAQYKHLSMAEISVAEAVDIDMFQERFNLGHLSCRRVLVDHSDPTAGVVP